MTDLPINNPQVSILIPVYNRKQYIAECIQSALNQIFKDFEIVLVDNASNDGTWEICQQFAALDQRVRIFRNETNIGPVRNWIRCAHEAKGVFSKVLFSDDSLEPSCLSEMVPILSDPEVALVYCAARIGKSRDQSFVAYSQVTSSRFSTRQFINLVISGNAPVSPCAVLIRTTDFLNNLHPTFPTATPRQFDINGAGPDVMVLLLTAQHYRYVANICNVLVYFRAHNDSFSIQNLNNNVVNGYHSSISLYLINNYKRNVWLDYLAQTWLRNTLLTKKWRSPIAHLIEYEGCGSVAELLQFCIFVFRHALKLICRKFVN